MQHEILTLIELDELSALHSLYSQLQDVFLFLFQPPKLL